MLQRQVCAAGGKARAPVGRAYPPQLPRYLGTSMGSNTDSGVPGEEQNAREFYLPPGPRRSRLIVGDPASQMRGIIVCSDSLTLASP